MVGFIFLCFTMKSFPNMFFPPLYRSVKYGYPTLLSSFFLLSHIKSKSFNRSESPSIPGFYALLIFFLCMEMLCLCSWNIFPVFHLVWGCNAAVLWWHLKRRCKEETVKEWSPMYFFLHTSNIIYIYEKVICAITVASHIPLFISFSSFTLLILHIAVKEHKTKRKKNIKQKVLWGKWNRGKK